MENKRPLCTCDEKIIKKVKIDIPIKKKEEEKKVRYAYDFNDMSIYKTIHYC